MSATSHDTALPRVLCDDDHKITTVPRFQEYECLRTLTLADLKSIWSERGRHWNSYLYEFMILKQIPDEDFIQREVLAYDPAPTRSEEAPWLPVGASPTAGCLSRLHFLWSWFSRFLLLEQDPFSGHAQQFQNKTREYRSKLTIYSRLIIVLENIHEAVLRKRMAAEPNAKKKLGVDFRYLMSVLPWSLFRDNNFRGVTRALIAVCVDHHPSLIIPVLNEEALWNATLFWTSEEKRALVFLFLKALLPPVNFKLAVDVVAGSVGGSITKGECFLTADAIFHAVLNAILWSAPAQQSLSFCSSMLAATVPSGSFDEVVRLGAAVQQDVSFCSLSRTENSKEPQMQSRWVRNLLSCKIFCLQYVRFQEKYSNCKELTDAFSNPFGISSSLRAGEKKTSSFVSPEHLTLYQFIMMNPMERIHTVLSTLAPYYIRVVDSDKPIILEVDALLLKNIVWDVLLYPARLHPIDAHAVDTFTDFYHTLWEPLSALRQHVPSPHYVLRNNQLFSHSNSVGNESQKVVPQQWDLRHVLSTAALEAQLFRNESFKAQDVALAYYCHLLLVHTGTSPSSGTQSPITAYVHALDSQLRKTNPSLSSTAETLRPADVRDQGFAFWKDNTFVRVQPQHDNAAESFSTAVSSPTFVCQCRPDWLPLALVLELLAASSRCLKPQQRIIRSELAVGDLLLCLVNKIKPLNALPATSVAAALERAISDLPLYASCLDATLAEKYQRDSRAAAASSHNTSDAKDATVSNSDAAALAVCAHWEQISEQLRQISDCVNAITTVQDLFCRDSGLLSNPYCGASLIKFERYLAAFQDSPKGSAELLSDILDVLLSKRTSPLQERPLIHLENIIKLGHSVFRDLSCDALCATIFIKLCEPAQRAVMENETENLIRCWKRYSVDNPSSLFPLELARCISEIVNPALSRTKLLPDISTLQFCNRLLNLFPFEETSKAVFNAQSSSVEQPDHQRDISLKATFDEMSRLHLLTTICLHVHELATDLHHSSATVGTNIVVPTALYVEKIAPSPLLKSNHQIYSWIVQPDCNDALPPELLESQSILSPVLIDCLIRSRQPFVLVGLLLHEFPLLATVNYWSRLELLLSKLNTDLSKLNTRISLMLLRIVTLIAYGDVPSAVSQYVELSQDICDANTKRSESYSKSCICPFSSNRYSQRVRRYACAASPHLIDPHLENLVEAVRWMLLDVACRLENHLLSAYTPTQPHRLSYAWAFSQKIMKLLSQALHFPVTTRRSHNDGTSSKTFCLQDAEDNDATRNREIPSFGACLNPDQRLEMFSTNTGLAATADYYSMFLLKKRLWSLQSSSIKASMFWETETFRNAKKERDLGWSMFLEQHVEQHDLPSQLAAQAARKTFKVLTFAASSMFPAAGGRQVDASAMLAGLKESRSSTPKTAQTSSSRSVISVSHIAQPVLTSSALSSSPVHSTDKFSILENTSTTEQFPKALQAEEVLESDSEILSAPLVDGWGDNDFDVDSVSSPPMHSCSALPSFEPDKHFALEEITNQPKPTKFFQADSATPDETGEVLGWQEDHLAFEDSGDLCSSPTSGSPETHCFQQNYGQSFSATSPFQEAPRPALTTNVAPFSCNTVGNQDSELTRTITSPLLSDADLSHHKNENSEEKTFPLPNTFLSTEKNGNGEFKNSTKTKLLFPESETDQFTSSSLLEQSQILETLPVRVDVEDPNSKTFLPSILAADFSPKLLEQRSSMTKRPTSPFPEKTGPILVSKISSSVPTQYNTSSRPYTTPCEESHNSDHHHETTAKLVSVSYSPTSSIQHSDFNENLVPDVGWDDDLNLDSETSNQKPSYGVDSRKLEFPSFPPETELDNKTLQLTATGWCDEDDDLNVSDLESNLEK